MAIRNSYVDDAGLPKINHQKCTFCLRCVKVCPTLTLVKGDGQVRVDPDTHLGCIGCLQCSAVCPEEAVSVSGRAIQAGDVIHLPSEGGGANEHQLEALLQSRRSIRQFKDKPVEPEKLQCIIELTSLAPMGIPPTDVRVLVFDTKEKVHELAVDNLESMKRSLPVMGLFRPPLGNLLMGRAVAAQMDNFILPIMREFTEQWSKGRDVLLYDAPAALYFHGTPWIDPADIGIAATYAMLAAETMGLGSCLIGSLHPFLIQNGKLSAKYGIPKQHKHGIVLILGYPAVEYSHAIRRRMGEVRYWQGIPND